MGIYTLLAQAEQTGEPIKDALNFAPVTMAWEQIKGLSPFQAVMALAFGLIWLLYGWRIFKMLVIICFGLMGLFAGLSLAEFLVLSPVWTAIVSLALFAFISVPLMKWSVCFLGAAAGGTITAGMWYAAGLPVEFIWAGAVIGIVAGGMMSFIVFKIAVMLFTSLSGGAITIISILALLNSYESHMNQPPTTYIHDWMFGYRWFLPLALLVPTIVGMIVQNKLIKHEHKWQL